MSETVNQETTATAAEQPEERTFTQAEMDAIISDRLKRERAKYADYNEVKEKAAQFDAAVEASKSDLQKAQEQAADYKAKYDALTNEIATRNARDKVANETGVPASLLTGSTEEECRKQAEMFLEWRGEKPKYPNLPDGGEVHKVSGGSTRDQFNDWFKGNFS